MKVKDILKKKPTTVITISPEESLHAASILLAEHKIGAVIVVDGSGTPVGILSERDIVREVAERGADAITPKISQVMTTDIVIALPEDDVSYLSNTMTSKRIRHLPVMQDKQLIGIISIGDVVKAHMAHLEVEAHTLRQYITGGYS